MIMFFLRGLENPKVMFDKEGDGGGNLNPADVSKLIERTEYLEKELKTVISQRDTERKEKADALSKLQEIDDKKKIEAGEIQKLADDYKKKYDELSPEVERLKKVEQLHNDYLEARKKSLLEKIPDDKKEEWKDSDLTILEKVVPLLSGDVNLGIDSGKTGKQNGKIKTEGKSWRDFGVAELDEIKKQDINEYNRLFREGNTVAL